MNSSKSTIELQSRSPANEQLQVGRRGENPLRKLFCREKNAYPYTPATTIEVSERMIVQRNRNERLSKGKGPVLSHRPASLSKVVDQLIRHHRFHQPVQKELGRKNNPLITVLVSTPHLQEPDFFVPLSPDFSYSLCSQKSTSCWPPYLLRTPSSPHCSLQHTSSSRPCTSRSLRSRPLFRTMFSPFSHKLRYDHADTCSSRPDQETHRPRKVCQTLNPPQEKEI